MIKNKEIDANPLIKSSSKKEKKFCGNYFVAVIRNSEWEGWIEQWEMENKSWEKMCFFDFFINFGLS